MEAYENQTFNAYEEKLEMQSDIPTCKRCKHFARWVDNKPFCDTFEKILTGKDLQAVAESCNRFEENVQ